MATEMAHVHNCILRALNSIYLQAPHVYKVKDIRDLLFFGKVWHTFVDDHHRNEEESVFPSIEAFTAKAGLMQKNVEQHHAFHHGLDRFRDYIVNTQPEDFDAATLRAIIDEFSTVFRQHLADEIETLLGLTIYDSVKLLELFKEAEKKAANTASKVSSELYPHLRMRRVGAEHTVIKPGKRFDLPQTHSE